MYVNLLHDSKEGDNNIKEFQLQRNIYFHLLNVYNSLGNGIKIQCNSTSNYFPITFHAVLSFVELNVFMSMCVLITPLC